MLYTYNCSISFVFSAIVISLLYYFQVENKDIAIGGLAVVSIIVILSLMINGILNNKAHNSINASNNDEHTKQLDEFDAIATNEITITKNTAITRTGNLSH